MDRSRRVEVIDPQGKVVCYLGANDAVNNCKIKAECNGVSTLTFSFYSEDDKLRAVSDARNRIRADGREYSILKDEALSVTRSQANVKSYVITAWETQFLLNYRYRTITNDPDMTSPAGCDVTILSGEKITSRFWVDGEARTNPFPVGSASYALFCLLDGTGWSVLGSDIAPDIKYDLETRCINVWENIMQMLKLWGGILEWDSVSRTVFLHDEDKWQDFDGFQIKYGKNMRSVERRQDNKIYTKLYVYGENHLSMKDVNGGKEYLEDYSYTDQVLEGAVENADIYDQNSLIQWGRGRLKKLSRPRCVYAGSALDLSKISNYRDAPPVLGHMADVIDADVAENGTQRQRLISIEYDFFKPWDCSLEIGDITGKFVKKYVDLLYVAKKSDSTINSGGNINGGNIRPGSYPELNDLEEEVRRGDEEIHLLIQNATGELYSKIDVTATEIRTEVADTTRELNTIVTQTAEELRLEANNTKDGLTSLISQTAGEIRAEMNNSAAGLRTEISVTAKGIRADMNDLDRALSSEISASARELKSEFRDDVSGLSSRITQNANSISAQAKQISLKADNVAVQGLVKITNGFANGTTTINGGCIKTGTISANRIQSGVFLAANGTFKGTVQSSGTIMTSGTVSGSKGQFNSIELGSNRLGKQKISIGSKSYNLVTWT